MKYAFIASLFLTLSTSCNKTYTCTCESGWGGEYTLEVKKPNRAFAKRKCASYNDPVNANDGTQNCRLTN